ncbi:hypothetical protein FHX73_11404 [Kitasatospora viridis]|uniref:Uncharacterized protein n=1 Tax=Kitasatospora viridis TaxID=281105 RepID=A0A561UB77_9ACTN|nr:hypothetical protein FHX73_11404 [Kitasatospora viridis]
MDIDATVIQAVTTAASAAGTAAGGKAWESLQAMLTRALKRRATGAEVATVEPAAAVQVDPGNEQQVRELCGVLLERREQDPELAAELAGWLRAQGGTHIGRLTNSLNDKARADQVIQTGQINGGITFNM